jgi:hypothetical protein
LLEAPVLKVTLFLLAAALVGCASTPEESAAAIQGDLPRLVAACNGAFRYGSQKGHETVTVRIAVITAGLDACDRLARAGSLDQVRPATGEIYQRYRDAMTNCLANNTIISANGAAPGPKSCPEKATVAITEWVAATQPRP